MLNVAFWNLGKNNCVGAVEEFAQLVASGACGGTPSDAVIGFAEYQGVDWDALCLKMGGAWTHEKCSNRKFIIMTNAKSTLVETKETSYAVSKKVLIRRKARALDAKEIIICFTHLPAPVGAWRPDNARHDSAEALKDHIMNSEKEWKNPDSIILGDLNMNPFDDAMVSGKGLNATMCREIARRDTRKWKAGENQKETRFFYNPMWRLLGDRTSNNQPGTFYHSGDSSETLFWHCLDQVLLRPSLIDSLHQKSPQIVTKLKSIDLLTAEGIINKNYSDHLPIKISLVFS